MFHDLTDDYKSRDYVIAITLKEGDYSGDIFYQYGFTGYGLLRGDVIKRSRIICAFDYIPNETQ